MPKESPRRFVAVAKTYNGPPVSVELDADKPKPKGETRIRVNARLPDLKIVSTPHEDVTTMFDLLKYAAGKHGDTTKIMTRENLEEVKEEKTVTKIIDGVETTQKKTWIKYKFGPYKSVTLGQFREKSLDIGSGLRHLGIEKGDIVTLYGATSANWLCTAHGLLSQSMIMSTSYDSLGVAGLSFSLGQTKAKAVYLDLSLINTLKESIERYNSGHDDKLPIKVVVYNHNRPVGPRETIDETTALIKGFTDAYPRVKLLSVEELVQTGKENHFDTVPPAPEDRCCIMYTSGSTGDPKGVILTHANVVASVGGANFNVGPYIIKDVVGFKKDAARATQAQTSAETEAETSASARPLGNATEEEHDKTDVLLAYLPLAHILEFVFENVALFWGAHIGYGGFRTLTDREMVQGCKGDIRELKPTILVGVPMVWDKIRKNIMDELDKNLITSTLFWGAYAAKRFATNWSIPLLPRILDKVVFQKVKDATGGRLRVTFNGGGPVNVETIRFISTAIILMINGYGLTETAAMGAIMRPDCWNDDSVGAITGCVEVKLRDWADHGYLTEPKDEHRPPQGEICIRGPSVAVGYLDNQKETQENFRDGWFFTGDIGEFDKKGNLKLIDRKKNLVKMVNGEYIALERLEMTYGFAQAVDSICIHANSDKKNPVAMVYPSASFVKSYIQTNKVPDGTTLETLVTDKGFHSAVFSQLRAAGKTDELKGSEILGGLVIDPQQWTEDNGCLTAVRKLNRKAIFARNKTEMEKIYNDMD